MTGVPTGALPFSPRLARAALRRSDPSAQPLLHFSADECAFIIDEAETKNGWVPQEFRYARDVVQQCEDLPEVRSWLETACRDSLFPLLQRTFPEVVGDGAAGTPFVGSVAVFSSCCICASSSPEEAILVLSTSISTVDSDNLRPAMSTRLAIPPMC